MSVFCLFVHFFFRSNFPFGYRGTEFFQRKKKQIDVDPLIKLIATQTARLAYEMGQKYLFVLCSHSFPFLWMSKFIWTYLKTVKQISQLNQHINSFVSYLKLYSNVFIFSSFFSFEFVSVFLSRFHLFDVFTLAHSTAVCRNSHRFVPFLCENVFSFWDENQRRKFEHVFRNEHPKHPICDQKHWRARYEMINV